MRTEKFIITSETGVHARPATLLVNTASRFASDIEISYKEKRVNLKSIMGVMSLGVPQGAEVEITVNGSDEDEALEAVTKIIKEHFGA